MLRKLNTQELPVSKAAPQQSGKLRPGAVVVVSPWPNTGSSNIFEAQTRFFDLCGREVALLIGPCDYWHNDYNYELLLEVEEAFSWSSVAHCSWASFGHDLRRAKFFGRLRWLLSGRDSDLKIQSRMALETSFTREFKTFVETHSIDVIYVNHVFQMILGERVASLIESHKRSRPKIFLETHDVQSMLNAKAFRPNRFSERADHFPTLLFDELSLISKADVITHVSESDRIFFSKRLPGKRHAVMPPTLSPTNERKLIAVRRIACSQPIDFLWIGNNNPGNVISIKWFLEYVEPHISNIDGLNISLVGTIKYHFENYEQELYKRFRRFFIGAVGDVIPYYKAAKVVMIPVTFGTGVSIKFIEAMCIGKPLVVTSLAYRGLPADLIEQLPVKGKGTPVSFAHTMLSLLYDPQELGAQCASFYDKHLSSQCYYARLSECTGIVPLPKHLSNADIA
jgi:polysaccharide biosynthesis protein PslH